jgi:hypothetical protein
VRRRGQQLERGLHGRGQSAQALELRSVRGELRRGRQVLVDEQMRDLLERAVLG